MDKFIFSALWEIYQRFGKFTSALGKLGRFKVLESAEKMQPPSKKAAEEAENEHEVRSSQWEPRFSFSRH